MFERIAVLCTGNICRSPIAEALLREQLATSGKQVLSAGTYAMVGQPADPISVELMREQGIDISGHRAQQATQALLKDCDLILVLDRSHLDWMNATFPPFRGRVHKIGRWPKNADILDPYRMPRAVFEEVRDRIAEGVAEWVRRIG